MPGLTLNTNAASSATSTGPAPGHQGTRRASTSPGASPAAPPMSPLTPTFTPAHLDDSAVNLAPLFPSQQTTHYNRQQQQQPAMLHPIPPPPPPLDFSAGRKTYIHTTHPDQIPVMSPPPAPPEPIDFADNPDVLALKSAISILQLQKARATRDIQTLGRVKEAALADPGGFIADLTSSKVVTEGDGLFPGGARRRQSAGDRMDIDGEEGSSSSDEEDDNNQSDKTTSVSPSDGNHKQPAPPPAWRTLPKPQNVVRCPPINWSQYGVVGESLDKLHAEQVVAPTQGTPATLTPGVGVGVGVGGGGLTYEFKGGDGKQERLVGVAAPYAPGRDKVAKKGKKVKR